ncbi:PREDICTED: uncharacterized protein LOC104824964 [Tarenaya hassleriana]|uniref:uncharacterized protein LOC104824964 n=1 Tax=Tarenaya hassleriana TaxID=28532 RepID=UPI00053C506C|nr:PREDICTED: uncharacterized protein LOC104824964 [Tarenaya hassleriana]
MSSHSDAESATASPIVVTPPSVSLDYSNPLYLYAADSTSLLLVTEKLLGDANYNLWSRAITKALTAKNKLGFIHGTISKPDDDHRDYGAWLRCNALICSWLLNAVSSDIASQVVCLDDAHIIWKTLETRFKQKNVAKIFHVQHQIAILQQGSMDVGSFFTKLNGLWEELKNYENLHLWRL